MAVKVSHLHMSDTKVSEVVMDNEVILREQFRVALAAMRYVVAASREGTMSENAEALAFRLSEFGNAWEIK